MSPPTSSQLAYALDMQKSGLYGSGMALAPQPAPSLHPQQPMTAIPCSVCRLPGHWALDCPSSSANARTTSKQEWPLNSAGSQQPPTELADTANGGVDATPTTATGRVWYCVACDQEFEADAKTHMSTHVACLAPNCSFSASKDVVLAHILAMHTGQMTGSQSVKKPKALPSMYTCKICKIPGHWIYDCKQYIAPKGEMAKQPVGGWALKLEPTQAKPVQESSAVSPSSRNVSNSMTKTEPNLKSWRCETCEKSFPNDSQLKSHFGDHVA
ncbi:hypothetical protein Gpo141_00014000, partial [Globisporangium polare]